MKHALMTCGLAATLLAPIGAEAARISRGIQVNPIDALIFEVIPTASGSYGDFWCGASEYARIEKGAGWRDYIYVVQGRSPSVTTGRRTAVQFTLAPEEVGVAPPPQGWLALGIRAGDRMSVQQARSYCVEMRVRAN